MTANRFGGQWTQSKLQVLREYLHFYTTALKAQNFRLIYIDCFAGTGRVQLPGAAAPIDGSARLALDCQPGFDRYHFIERDRVHLAELRALIDSHPRSASCQLAAGDAADLLWPLLAGYERQWGRTRGVLFLDPFGLQCTWAMLQNIAATKALDVFFLVSLSGLYRQAARKASGIDSGKSARLTGFLGTDEWRSALYSPPSQSDMFDPPVDEREAGWRPLLAFVTTRLKSLFPYASEPHVLGTSNGAPLFALFFCCANPSGPAVALASRVSRDILGKLDTRV